MLKLFASASTGWVRRDGVCRRCARTVPGRASGRYLSQAGGGGDGARERAPPDDGVLGRVAARVKMTRLEFSQQQFAISGALRELPQPPFSAQREAATARSLPDVSERGRPPARRAAMSPRSSAALRGSLPRCVAYCTAETYNWDELLKALQKDMVPSIYFSEVIHVSVPNETMEEEGDVFFFRDGSMVLWDVCPARTRQLLSTIEPFQVGAYERADVLDSYSEAIEFTYGKQAGVLPTGEMVLSYGQSNWAKAQILEKIAFSHGMQRSVKISVIEDISDRLIASIKQIPDILTEKRALKLDQKAVMKTMGQLLSLRGLINLHLPLNETPEAYWEEPWLEELYSKISRELDLAGRIRNLNRKLDYTHQVVDVLRSELAERHHVRLEKIIIYLIAMELAFEILHFLV